MTTTNNNSLTGLLPDEHRVQLRRAVIASTVGTTIEWYDFLLYGTVTGLVFGKLFFPNSTPIVGVLQAFGVFFIGFVGRPIGAAIFGHWGDRIGRKATLIATLLIRLERRWRRGPSKIVDMNDIDRWFHRHPRLFSRLRTVTPAGKGWGSSPRSQLIS